MLKHGGGALIGLLAMCGVWVDVPETFAEARPAGRLEAVAADVVAATAKYRAALERVLTIYERELEQRSGLVELRQDLYERGVLSRHEFEDAQRILVETRMNVEDTRRAIAEADRMLTEAWVAEALARLAPIERGVYERTPGLARYEGSAPWSLVEGVPRLQQRFLAHFGQPLPISAFGQTALHDRMGFDHGNALDVAVHPDSSEGRWLIDHLRTTGIPFIAAWGAVPGSTSGAHIHVGQPSPRLVGRR